MNDDVRGWRAVPTMLRVAFVVWLAWIPARLVSGLVFEPLDFWGARMMFAGLGIGLACDVLALVGLLELARRVTGRIALGTRIAAGGFAFSIARDVAFAAIDLARGLDGAFGFPDGYGEALRISSFAVALVPMGGMVIAVWASHRTLALLAVVASVVTTPPPGLDRLLYGWTWSVNSARVVDAVAMLVHGTVLFAMTIAIARGSTVPDSAMAARGLRRGATALWLRVLAACAAVLVTLLAATSGGVHFSRVVQWTVVAAAVVNVIALAMFGVGIATVVRGARADVPRHALVVAAFAVLWCAGVAFGQLQYTVSGLHDWFGLGSYLAELTQTFAVFAPLVVIGAAGLVAWAIGQLAARRGELALRAHAQSKGVGFVSLMLVNVAIQSWMIPKSDKLPEVALLGLLAAGVAVAATVAMARLCTLAADELERDVRLPVAKVVAGTD